jgi:hypothetical protein
VSLEILRVDRVPLDERLFLGGGIDLPVAGEKRDHFTMVIAGWVLHRDHEQLHVEARSNGQTVGRWYVGEVRGDVVRAFSDLPVTPRCGFVAAISTIALPAEFELQIEVVGEIQVAGRIARAPLGTIYGCRSALAPEEPHQGPAPLFVTTLGRTGSTYLMSLLFEHPEIVVHPPFPFEARLMAYWGSILDNLGSPYSHLKSLVANSPRGYWWVGTHDLMAAEYVDQDPAAQWLGGEAVSEFCRFARGQVRGFYKVSARLDHRPASAVTKYFAEKRLPLPRLQQVCREIFPHGRELFLVRDFRDVLTSILAFNAKRGKLDFGVERLSGEEHVAALARGVEKLLADRAAAGSHGLVVRYEDLIRDPHGALRRILQFAELDADAATIDKMIAGSAAANQAAQLAHRTTVDGAASIGRWLRELTPELRLACDRLLTPYLAELEYSIG